MNETTTSLLEAQCWTCGMFDNLFVIISNTAAAVYDRLVFFGIVIFCALLGFYIINAVWQNIKKAGEDPFLQKSIKPIVVKSMLVLTLLLLGLMVPRLISQITFEPVATLTLRFSEILTPDSFNVVSNYTPIDFNDTGFFSVQLRDTLLELIKTSVANFQIYIQVGLNIIESAFCLNCLLGVAFLSTLVRHLIVFFIGLFLTYNFIKLFIKYSFVFMDIIVAMAMFAFFFPISLVFFIFKDATELPEWMKGLGTKLGSDQVKKLINAIVSVASAVLTYTIIMLIIQGYLNSNGIDSASLQTSSYESLFDFDLENTTAAQITFAGAIVLIYVIRYLADQVPKITEKIMSVFNVSQEDKLSKEMGENVWKLTNLVKDSAKNFAKDAIKAKTATPSGTPTTTAAPTGTAAPTAAPTGTTA